MASKEQLRLIAKAREVLANYRKNEMLIRIGEYKRGSDRDADYAIDHIDPLNRFLRQTIEDGSTFEETLQQLKALFK